MLSKSKTIHERRLEVLKSLRVDSFVRPIDIGGTDSSHHSSDLRWLADNGYVIKKRTPTWIRPQYQYKRSDKGELYLLNK